MIQCQVIYLPIYWSHKINFRFSRSLRCFIKQSWLIENIKHRSFQTVTMWECIRIKLPFSVNYDLFPIRKLIPTDISWELYHWYLCYLSKTRCVLNRLTTKTSSRPQNQQTSLLMSFGIFSRYPKYGVNSDWFMEYILINGRSCLDTTFIYLYGIYVEIFTVDFH